MALMDVLRLFDLNPEKIAAITADGVPAMTGKMNRREEKKLKSEKLVPDILSYLFILFFTNQAWQLGNPFVRFIK